MPFYVQKQTEYKKEVRLKTVGAASTRKDAATLATNYRHRDPSAIYYVSNTPCAGWKDK